MILMFKQRILSLFGSYDIYDEAGNTVYTVTGEAAWGSCFRIYGANGEYLGTVKEKLQLFAPSKFEIFIGDDYVGIISKRITFFTPKLDVEYMGWQVTGDVFEWDYTILSPFGDTVATIEKRPLNLTDTYVIDVAKREDALHVLMLVLAIDAEKDNRD